jgi:hypothetical protein
VRDRPLRLQTIRDARVNGLTARRHDHFKGMCALCNQYHNFPADPRAALDDTPGHGDMTPWNR